MFIEKGCYNGRGLEGYIVLMKRHDQNQVVDKMIYLTHISTSYAITEGSEGRSISRERIWEQELMQRSWSGTAY